MPQEEVTNMQQIIFFFFFFLKLIIWNFLFNKGNKKVDEKTDSGEKTTTDYVTPEENQSKTEEVKKRLVLNEELD